MSINDQLQKIKQFLSGDKGKAFYITLLIIMVSGSSFGLGRLSKTLVSMEPVRIEYEAQSLVANATQIGPKAGLPAETSASAGDSATGLFVASRRGKKYYPIKCSAASTLKEDNKIFFNTEAEAQSAGYTISSSC